MDLGVEALTELPFYSASYEDLLGITPDDLLLDGFQNLKYPHDGFLSFHSLKMCCSNAKQMAQFLEYSMGFKLVAYRGLENDSRTVASHVVKNGGVVFELVNTLGLLEEAPVPSNLKSFDPTPLKEKAAVKLEQDIGEFVINLVQAQTGFQERNEFTSLVEKAVGTARISSAQKKAYLKFLDELAQYTLNTADDVMLGRSIQDFVTRHGDGVFDITLIVQHLENTYERALEGGARCVSEPRLVHDEHGWVKTATINLPLTDICHTLIENINYLGPFLPGYVPVSYESQEYIERLNQMPPVHFWRIDHCVENYTWNQMMEQATLYARIFGFHKYWSVDEADVATENTSLRSIVMASSNGRIKIPINEPSKGKKRGQIEEFYDFNGGPGVQHIALLSTDIIATVTLLVQRGIGFNTMRKHYYDELRQRLKNDDIVLKENIDVLQRLNILVDYDSSSRRTKDRGCNYILQIFTKPLHDRPTLFFEVIQRHHHNGFGKGTFKGLFKSIEEQQEKRGTLVDN